MRLAVAMWVALAAAQPSIAETRRAVVVGINQYDHAFPAPPPDSNRIPVRGEGAREKWTNLEGAVSDATEMRDILASRYGFAPANILLLTDKQATAAAILSALEKHLVDEAARGDVSLFYYAGHGSQIRNTKSDEADGMDETIVPADASAGTPDLRDRELARIYRRAVEKGIRLTVILDSCHSGSAARGAIAARGKMRRLDPDRRYVEDAPESDASGKKLPSPEESGALILSAAQDFEPAFERATETGPHGLFSWALFQVLRTSAEGEPVRRIFDRTRALMQSEGSTQEPVLAGRGRAALSLLGSAAEADVAVTAAVQSINGATVRLQAGAAANLTEGCELRRTGSAADVPLRLRVTKVSGVNSSEAAVIEGSIDSLQPGTLFQVDRWVVQESSALRLHIPPAMEEAAMRSLIPRLQQAAEQAGAAWVTDPAEQSADAVLRWTGSHWRLRTVDESVAVGAGAAPDVLCEVLQKRHVKRLFVLLPPTPALAKAAVKVAGNVVVTPAEDSAHYVLIGRAMGNQVSYAWALPEPLAGASMPVRTDWMDAENGNFAASAAALARIRAWLLLHAPSADLRFPYQLVLRKEGPNGQRPSRLIAGEKYKLFLELPGGAQPSFVAKTWVYVFAIDSHGKGSLLFPPKGQGNVGNRFPLDGNPDAPPPAAIALSPDSYDLEISPPYGVDSYFLLASKEPLANPDVLDFDGVRHEGRGAKSDTLTQLLDAIATGTRGQRPTVRATWTIQRQTFPSAAQP